MLALPARLARSGLDSPNTKVLHWARPRRSTCEEK